MIKEVLNYFDASLFAEVAVVMFAAVFVAIVIRTLLTGKETTEQQANIVLDDPRRKSDEQ